jgi:deoxyribose-phosphate aldolase
MIALFLLLLRRHANANNRAAMALEEAGSKGARGIDVMTNYQSLLTINDDYFHAPH